MAKKIENTIAAMSGFPGDGGLGKPEETMPDPADTETPVPEPQEPNPIEAENIVVDFPMPEGFAPPSGVKSGEEFTALASLKMGANGELQLTKIDGIPVNGKEEEESETAEQEGEQNKPGATGAAPSTGGSAIASARNVMGDFGMPA